MSKTYIGLDNGTSGTIGILRADGGIRFGKVPSKTEQSYTKKKQEISRIDVIKLKRFLLENVDTFEDKVFVDRNDVMVILERPFTGKFFKSVVSAARALEATLCVLEDLGLPYQYIDSKEWQKSLLPAGTVGPKELKKASLQIGTRLFPQIESKHKDRDGILIAEYGRRAGL